MGKGKSNMHLNAIKTSSTCRTNQKLNEFCDGVQREVSRNRCERVGVKGGNGEGLLEVTVSETKRR